MMFYLDLSQDSGPSFSVPWFSIYITATAVMCIYLYTFLIGTYVCGFTSGSVMYTAKAQLNVALLPDTISLQINPLTVDCSLSPKTADVEVTATISNSTESFEVWWSYNGDRKGNLYNNCKTNLW